MAVLTTFDSRQLRNVLGTFTTGVTIVTTQDAQGAKHGVTANSFSSVSLDPPLVLWSQSYTSKSYAAFHESEYFTVNILADDQIAISNHFAKSQEDKFATVPFREGLGGSPVLEGTVAHFECVKVASYPAGDHMIYLGRVERVSHSGRRPLAFSHGRYMIPYTHDLGPVSLEVGRATVAAVEAIRLVSDAMPAFAEAAGGPTLCLAVWGNHGPTAIRWERGKDALSEQLRTGLVMSVTRTATGRAFAAFLPADVTQPFIDEDLRLFRVADEDEKEQRLRFDEELVETRRSGLARTANLEPTAIHQVMLHAFSAPIYNRGGEMILALSAACAAHGVDPDRDGSLPKLLLAHAAEMTRLIADELG